MARGETGRRIVVCCDGTWKRADSGKAATNVLRLARVVRPVAADGTTQIVAYLPGVGTGSRLDRLLGGGTGLGLLRNVRDAYAFIVNNWREGDEIFLFGFSRGAYTVRSVGGLIGRIGLLRKHHMGCFAEAWEFSRRPADERARLQAAFDARFEGRCRDVPVRCIGVWDTVGALGVPAGLFGNAALCGSAYAFLDTTLGAHVEHAFHALAMDERRAAFTPTLWQPHPAPRCEQTLRQVWFRGAHSDVGGGYAEHGAADLAFLWMASQVDNKLDLDDDAIERELDRRRRWGEGPWHDSRVGLWKLLGPAVDRTVAAGPDERVHASVPAGQPHASWPAGKVAPLGALETEMKWPEPEPWPAVAPVVTHRPTFCDRVVAWLGGG